MSKYQEAKDNIVNTLARQIDYKTYKNLYSKDFDTLQELVDKATPKKIRYENAPKPSMAYMYSCPKPKENTSEFKHFKLHSDSSLKNLTKVELIDYIKMLYNNWGVTDEQLKRVIDKAKELSDSNDELRRHLYFIEPYKFEDLKPNMWVWDDLIKKCVQLDEDCFEPNNVILILMHGNYGYRESTRTFFEENRFFPVQCANWNGSER